MANSSFKAPIGSVRYAAIAAGGLLVTLVGISSFVRSVPPSEDLDARRGDHRAAALLKLTVDEQVKIEKVTKPEWVNKEAGVARIPLDAAIDFTVVALSAKAPKASAVKVDPVLAPIGDSPNMPSSPSGAINIRFPSLQSHSQTSN